MSGRTDGEFDEGNGSRSDAATGDSDAAADDVDGATEDGASPLEVGDGSAPEADPETEAVGSDSRAETEVGAVTGNGAAESQTQPSASTTPDADEPADGSVTMSFDDGETAGSDSLSSDGDLRYKTTPMLRPVLVLLGSVLVGGSIALSIPLLRPGLFGDQALADIVLYAIAVLVTVTVVRLAVRLVVLWRTEYEIRDDALVRRYNLAYKRTVRRIPVSKLRGHEFAQSRYQASLGVGTIRLLTAGTNRSLGFLAFEHLKDPDAVREEIQTLLAERAARAED